MKIETKRKIIYWIKKLIQYDETKDLGSFRIEKKYEPILLKQERTFNQEEWEYVCQHELLRKNIATAFANILSSAETNIIKIEFEPDFQTDGMKVVAKLTCLETK